MATHSSVLAWRIPGTGEPGGLPSMGPRLTRLSSSRSSGVYMTMLLSQFVPPSSFPQVSLSLVSASLFLPWN